MADLTPDERAALNWVLPAPTGTLELTQREIGLVWRAARAYQAEQDARIAFDWPLANGMTNNKKAAALSIAAAIRERAKGLT